MVELGKIVAVQPTFCLDYGTQNEADEFSEVTFLFKIYKVRNKNFLK